MTWPAKAKIQDKMPLRKVGTYERPASDAVDREAEPVKTKIQDKLRAMSNRWNTRRGMFSPWHADSREDSDTSLRKVGTNRRPASRVVPLVCPHPSVERVSPY